MNCQQPLNQILYGPPGTGKTYSTMKKAVEIIDCEEYKIPDDGVVIIEKFNKYKKAGLIEFVTFHQSYGYEEFIEGIRAIPAGEEGNEYGNEMIYKQTPGVFKRFCKINCNEQITRRLFIKINPENNATLDECYFTIIDKGGIENAEELNEGDIVLFCTHDGSGGNKRLKSILECVGKEDIKSGKKIYIRILADFKSFGGLDYRFDHNSPFFKKENTTLNGDVANAINKNKNKVFIIDEINRGNISKIFGELITLIEPNKRLGAKEELSVKLPYSGEEFGIPSNVHIIGTMNSADKSIALLDTALRRRFEFEEIMPDPKCLKETVDGIELKQLLTTINQRIEYLYDRDHTIGHAYFMGIENIDYLGCVMKNKIIPLLQEYFYDDWEKIRLVLGDNQKSEDYQFIIVNTEADTKTLFGNDESIVGGGRSMYEINENAFKEPKSYTGIYENAKN
ncbi:MAG: McrB family protein [Campylobacterales bacterium]